MKDFLTLLIAAIVMWLVTSWFDAAYGEDIAVQEMSMKTETGEIVLTTEPCEYIKMGLKGYPYAAYATEKGKANHEGCWKVDIVDRYSAILVYFPEIDATAVYNPKLFSPRKKVDPNVSFEPKFEEGNRIMLYEVFTF